MPPQWVHLFPGELGCLGLLFGVYSTASASIGVGRMFQGNLLMSERVSLVLGCEIHGLCRFFDQGAYIFHTPERTSAIANFY